MEKKKIPPFGWPLFNLIKKGLRPKNDVLLFIGNYAFKKGRSFSINSPMRTLVLPPWLPSEHYYWPVKQCDVLIFDTGYAEINYVENIVCCLFKDEANVVRFISPNQNLTIYKKDF